MDERELFSKGYAAVEPEALWSAVKRALATMGFKHSDDAQKTAEFTSGVSLTSWGEAMHARVVSGDSGGARLVVSGRPKVLPSLTPKWGEDVHARKVEKELLSAVDAALEDGSPDAPL